MDLIKRLILLIVAVTLFFGAPRAAIAVDGKEAKLGPLSDYCSLVRNRIIEACATKFTWDKEISISIALDDNGIVVDTGKGAAAEQKRSESIIRALKELPAPPRNTKRPFWLTVDTSRKTEKILVSVRDVDFGPYMSNLQTRIKRTWSPPKGKVCIPAKMGERSGLKVGNFSGSFMG